MLLNSYKSCQKKYHRASIQIQIHPLHFHAIHHQPRWEIIIIILKKELHPSGIRCWWSRRRHACSHIISLYVLSLGKSYCCCVKQTFEASRAALCPPMARQWINTLLLLGFLMGHWAVNEAVEYQMIDPFYTSPWAAALPFPLAVSTCVSRNFWEIVAYHGFF